MYAVDKKVFRSSGLSLLDSLDASVLIVDSQSGKILLSNKRADRLFGLDQESEDSIVGFQFQELCFSEEDNVDRALEFEHLQLANHYSGVAIRSVSGEKIIIDVTIETLPGKDSLIALTIRNVDHVQGLLKNLEEKDREMESLLVQLRDQNQELVRLDEMKNKFISLVSHELRTPLSGMLGYADLLSKNLVDSEEQKKEFLKVIYDEGVRLSEIVNDFLDLSRMIAGKIELYVSYMNVMIPLKKAIECIEGFASKKKINIKTECDLEAVVKGYMDPDKMQQVFLNIMNNAVKFSPEGSDILIRIQDSDPKFIEMSFEDHGIGIRESDHSKVFADFEMVENISEHQKGTGLGMPLCKRFMESQKGDIFFTSTFGKGTTFFVRIPKEKLLPEECYKEKFSEDSSIIF